jgi:hypothetical protein
MKVSCVVSILALAGTVAAAPQRKRILKLHKSNNAAGVVERGLQPGMEEEEEGPGGGPGGKEDEEEPEMAAPPQEEEELTLAPTMTATHSSMSHSMSLSMMTATEPPKGGAAVKETPVPSSPAPSSPAPSTPAPSTAPPVEETNAPKGGNKDDDTYAPSPVGSMSMSMDTTTTTTTTSSTIPTLFVDVPLTATPTNPKDVVNEPSGTAPATAASSAMMIGTCLAGVAIIAATTMVGTF